MPEPAFAAVSVVIPAYKASATIAETLDSIFAQSVLPREVIVVNDGSPDTPDLDRAVQPYLQRIQYIKQKNQGVSAARNTGIKAATQPLLAFLDADDLWKPRYVEHQSSFLAEGSGVDLVFPNGMQFGPGPENGKIFWPATEVTPVTFESLVRLKHVVSTSVMARREIILKAGLYDEALRTCEDFDLWLRVLKAGGRITYHFEVLLLHRLSPGSLSTHQHWMYRDFLAVLEKCERTMALTPAEQEAIRLQKADYRAEWALYEGKAAFFQGNTPRAIEELQKAHRHLGGWKLGLSIRALRLAPGLLLALYGLRDRVFRTNSRLRYHAAADRTQPHKLAQS